MSDAAYVQIGGDLESLARQHLPPIASVSPVSRLVSREKTAAAFRIEAVDGSVWKGRRFESAPAADIAIGLGRLLPARWVPGLVAAGGAAAIYDWIDGAPLPAPAVEASIARQAGAFLREVHGADVPERVGDELRLQVYPGHNWRGMLLDRLGCLVAAGAIDAAARARAVDVAARYEPAPRAAGLVHGDLCPENMVVSGGRLWVVDNDGVAVHVPEFDLARTWYRWNMTDTQWQAFRDGYGDRDVLEAYDACFPHWAIVVLAGVAEFRTRHALPGAEPAVARLRDVLTRCG